MKKTIMIVTGVLTFCEESDFRIFWDAKTYAVLSSLERPMTWRIASEYSCIDETIQLTGEHMPDLMKTSPAKAREIVENGTKVRIVVYEDLSKQVETFVEELLAE